MLKPKFNQVTAPFAVALAFLAGSGNWLACFADDTSAIEKMIMDGAAAPSVSTSGAAKAAPNIPATSAPVVPMVAPAKPGEPATESNRMTAPQAINEGISPLPAVHRTEPEHTTEKAPEQRAEVEKRSVKSEKAVEKDGLELHFEQGKMSTAKMAPPASSSANVPTYKAAAKTTMLFGRIEQLAGTSGAKFPELRAMTPHLDTREQTLKASATRTSQPMMLSGTTVKSFPTNYAGNWGGNLTLQQVQIDPGYYALDRDLAARTNQIMRVGNQGTINFNFTYKGGKAVYLEPAHLMFLIPIQQTDQADQVSKMLGQSGGANSPMGAMIQQMVGNTPVPVLLEFGEFQTGGMVQGISGNQGRQTVVKNDLRELSGNVLEQDIVTSEVATSKSTGRTYQTFGETVLRFTNQGGGRMYVQAAAVNYDANRRFLDKLVMAGYVQQGYQANNNPASAVQIPVMIPGMGAGGQAPQMPQGMGGMGGMGGMDPSGLQNMLKQLFGGQ